MGGNITQRGGPSMGELRPQLGWIPSGKPEWHPGWMNGYARGLELILGYLGHDVDYITIMGDMGQAFITQGEENSINRFDGAVDVGWWPLEPLGIVRFNFLERTVGREIQDVKVPPNEPKKDPVTSYRQWFEPVVVSSLEDNIPCLARVGSSWYVVTGYDDHEEAPLIGMCPNTERGAETICRIEERMPPYVVLAVGETVPTVDRTTADYEALKFAIALHRDQVLGIDMEYAGEYPLRRADELGKYWRTGLKSFSSWIDCLDDTDHPGEPRWYSNIKGWLVRNRKTAVRYLTAMQKRHSKTIADHLESAIQEYEAVIEETENIDTSREAVLSAPGRRKMTSTVERIANLESQAAGELQKAMGAFS